MTTQARPRRIARSIVLAAILGFGLPVAVTAPAAPALAAVDRPNPLIVWDRYAQQAIWEGAGQAPPDVAARSFSMVSGAVYDAVNAIAGTPLRRSSMRACGAVSISAAPAPAPASTAPSSVRRLPGTW